MEVTTLLMHFVDGGGEKFTLSLDNPKDSLTALDIQTVMQTVITQNAVYGKKGELTAVHSAQLVTRRVDTLM